MFRLGPLSVKITRLFSWKRIWSVTCFGTFFSQLPQLKAYKNQLLDKIRRKRLGVVTSKQFSVNYRSICALRLTNVHDSYGRSFEDIFVESLLHEAFSNHDSVTVHSGGHFGTFSYNYSSAEYPQVIIDIRR